MANAVFTTSESSAYDDQPEVRYHFPHTYLKQAEQAVGDYLRALQTDNLAMREHEHTPLFEIQRWAGLGGEALFDSILVFENYPVSEALAQGAPQELRFGEIHNHEQTNYPLTLLVHLSDELSMHFSYQCESFAAHSVGLLPLSSSKA